MSLASRHFPRKPSPFAWTTNQKTIFMLPLLVTDEALEPSWPWETGLLRSDTKALEPSRLSHGRAGGPWAGPVSVRRRRLNPAGGRLPEERMHCGSNCEPSSQGSLTGGSGIAGVGSEVTPARALHQRSSC